MFRASIDVRLGDGRLALFWSDYWLGTDSPCIVAPELCKLVRPRVVRLRTVRDALVDRAWTQDITRQLTVTAIRQYMFLWARLRDVQLQPDVEDTIAWRWCSSATYSARSAYRMFFEGSMRFVGARPIWKAWAPLKVKFFAWLAVKDRLWTAERRHRHGLQDPSCCKLCDQDLETSGHLFVSCSYTRQVWHAVSQVTSTALPAALPQQLLDWWLLLRAGHHNLKQKGLDSMVMLISWSVWKERNSRTFDTRPERTVAQLVDIILEEGHHWTLAGAKHLAAVGWPSPAVVGRATVAG
ncbi:unnamed protein product [Urochloa humidicola]